MPLGNDAEGSAVGGSGQCICAIPERCTCASWGYTFTAFGIIFPILVMIITLAILTVTVALPILVIIILPILIMIIVPGQRHRPRGAPGATPQ